MLHVSCCTFVLLLKTTLCAQNVREKCGSLIFLFLVFIGIPCLFLQGFAWEEKSLLFRWVSLLLTESAGNPTFCADYLQGVALE